MKTCFSCARFSVHSPQFAQSRVKAVLLKRKSVKITARNSITFIVFFYRAPVGEFTCRYHQHLHYPLLHQIIWNRKILPSVWILMCLGNPVFGTGRGSNPLINLTIARPNQSAMELSRALCISPFL